MLLRAATQADVSRMAGASVAGGDDQSRHTGAVCLETCRQAALVSPDFCDAQEVYRGPHNAHFRIPKRREHAPVDEIQRFLA